MRRIDRMHLNREVGRPGERAVRLERGDHIARRAEMNVEGGDHCAHRSIPDRPGPAWPGARDAAPVPPRRSAGPPCGRRPRTPCARPGCAARGPRAAPPDTHRSSGSGSRPATGRARRPAAAACATACRPSPAAPARRAPSTVNVACQMRSTRCGFAGYSRSPPGSGRPAQASRSICRCPASRIPRSALSWPNAAYAERLPPGPTPTSRRPPRHQVEHRGVLGDSDRQLQRQGDDPRPQADPRCLGGDLGQEDERRGKAAFILMEMMLGDPGRIEAAAFGVDDLRGGQPVALGGVRLIEQAREEAQALGRRSSRHLLQLVLLTRMNDIARVLSSISECGNAVSTTPHGPARSLCITGRGHRPGRGRHHSTRAAPAAMS